MSCSCCLNHLIDYKKLIKKMGKQIIFLTFEERKSNIENC